MWSRAGRALLVAGVVGGVVALTACASVLSGHGSGPTAPSGSGSHTPDFPSGSPAAPTPSGETFSASVSVPPPTSSSATNTGRPLTVTGLSGRSYETTVWASDDLTNCADHAYGTAMVTFLRKHPCRTAHRVLATLDLDGRNVVVSAISASFPGTASDPYVYAGRFKRLELADGTGSINDLLREGARIPGVSGGIPSREAFSVIGQDSSVTVFDAWYVSGATADQARDLVRLEQDLFLSELTSA